MENHGSTITEIGEAFTRTEEQLTLIMSAWSHMEKISLRATSSEGHRGFRRLGSYDSQAPFSLAIFMAARWADLHGSAMSEMEP